MTIPKLNFGINLNDDEDKIEKTSKKTIPSLASLYSEENNSKFLYNQNDDIITRNKETNTLNLLEQGFESKRGKGTLGIGYINLDAFLEAPKGFFNRYDNIVVNIVEYIQDSLSRGDKAVLMGQIRANPVNMEIKEKALLVINGEFTRYENSRSRIPEFLNLSNIEKKLVLALVANEIIGLGPLQPMFDDFRVREIVCNGPYDIQVEIDGSMKKIESISFRNVGHIEDLIARLYNSVNKEFSRSNPLERARLYDNSRVFAAHTVVAPDGPNLNIRRHTDNWVSPEQYLAWGSCSPELMEWLGNMVYHGLSMVVVGSTGTGKTTLLGALTGFFPNNKRIVVIERNIEMKGCPTKLFAASMEVLQAKSGSSTNKTVTMRDLVEASTQMRPDIIILGESTGDEAYDILNAANSGHQVFTTIHANSAAESSDRLVTLTSQTGLITGKAVFSLISAAVDVVVVVTRFDKDGSRKVTEVCEVATRPEMHPKNNELYLPVKPIFNFKPNSNSEYTDKVTGEWIKTGELSEERRKKHRLEIAEHLTLDELFDLYKVGD